MALLIVGCSRPLASVNGSLKIEQAVKQCNFIFIGTPMEIQKATKKPDYPFAFQTATFKVKTIFTGSYSDKEIKLTYMFDEKNDVLPKENEEVIVFVNLSEIGKSTDKIIQANSNNTSEVQAKVSQNPVNK